MFRRPKRESVPATGSRDFDPWFNDPDDPDPGSASVREPRRPKPLGPLSDAGELPLPQQHVTMTLPDPRW